MNEWKMYKMYNLMGMNVEWEYLSGKCVKIIGLIRNILKIIRIV